MKQLLHTSNSNLLLSALNDHAYAIVTSSKDEKSVTVYELIPTSITTEANVRGNSKTNDTSNTIQAVACACTKEGDDGDGKRMICAVSRLDKTIELYSILLNENDGEEESDEKDKKEVKSMAMYKTGKRACSLAFAKVPGGGDDDDDDDGMAIIIAADLAGDVTAFPVPNNNGVKDSTTSESSTVSRLLLGHTASMLTGVHITTDSNQKMRIITSDRDEKIRISSFPNTYVVEGYLLGHTAFVSAIDVATEVGCTRCVSCGGDGTIRLWDYEKCEEIAVLEGVVKQQNEGEEEEEEEQEEEDEGEKKNDNEEKADKNDVEMKGEDNENKANNGDDRTEKKQEKSNNETTASMEEEEEDDDANNLLIPFGVSLNSNATKVAVIREGTSSLDIYSITEAENQEDEKIEFQKIQTIECTSSSQPLGVRFFTDEIIYVLSKEPEYLKCFHYDKSKSLFTSHNKKDSTDRICETLQTIAENAKISMPQSVLETDNRGQIKLVKVQQKPAFAKNEELWNNSSRIVTAKKRNARRRKRRRDAGLED